VELACPTCWSSGRGRANAAAAFAADAPEPYLDPVQVQTAVTALARRSSGEDGDDPYADPARPAGADGKRLVRRSSGSRPISMRRWPGWPSCVDAGRPSAHRGRNYNPGWNLVFELDHLLTVSEAITAEREAADREPRGAQPARLSGPDDTRWNGNQQRDLAGRRRNMAVTTAPLPPLTDELRGLLRSTDH